MQSTELQVVDTTLDSDRRWLVGCLLKAKKSEGLTLGFASASIARSTRRRMYYVAQHLSNESRQLCNEFEFKLTGRMIAIFPKKMLSTTITTLNSNSMLEEIKDDETQNGPRGLEDSSSTGEVLEVQSDTQAP